MIKEVTKLYGIDDIVAYPIIKDSKKEFTYSNGIRLTGVREISLTYRVDQKEAKDCFEVSENIKDITFNIDTIKLSKEEIDELCNDYCVIKMQILDTHNDGGDIHFYIYKALLSVNDNQIIGIGEYTVHEFDNKRKLIDIKINDRPVNLIAIEDTDENKSLSQQICELCRIEPFTRRYCNFECNDEKIGLFCNKKDCKYSKILTKYPDFETNNNNFVKLLSLKTDCFEQECKQIPYKPIWWVVNTHALKFSSLAPYDIQSFLISLLVILENKNNTYSINRINEIKQIIRQTNWENQ